MFSDGVLSMQFCNILRDRVLPRATAEGDVVLLDSTGAYGTCMGNLYNLRPVGNELCVEF